MVSTVCPELPPPPYDVEACNITDSTATIKWNLREGNSICKVSIRFQVAGQLSISHMTEINVEDLPALQFQFTGLKANTSYLVDIWVKNNIGESLKNPPIQLKTLLENGSGELRMVFKCGHNHVNTGSQINPQFHTFTTPTSIPVVCLSSPRALRVWQCQQHALLCHLGLCWDDLHHHTVSILYRVTAEESQFPA